MTSERRHLGFWPIAAAIGSVVAAFVAALLLGPAGLDPGDGGQRHLVARGDHPDQDY